MITQLGVYAVVVVLTRPSC